MFNPIKRVKDLSYGTGYWTGQIFVIPFLDGFIDSVEPHITNKIQTRVFDKAIPGWVKGLFS